VKGQIALRLKRSSVVLLVLVLVGILTVSTVALAEHEESHDEDTLFSFGYDEVNHLVAINIGPNDTLYVCDFGGGPLEATYGEAAEGVIPVDSLKHLGTVKTFDRRFQHELAADLVEASGPIEYSPTGECGVSGALVAGPNGQINHGQFMKAAKSLLDVEGQGCVVRYLAKADVGKTETTKLRTSDVDPAFEVGETGDLTFSTFEADCSHGKQDKDAEAENQDKGRPDSPGRSGDAPGKNKGGD
jgi:hypothetical protein